MTDTPKADLLDQLVAVYQRRQQLDAERDKVFAEEVALVAALRPTVAWQEIADRLGRKKQNVIVTYRPRLEETRTVRVRPNPEEPAAETSTTPAALPVITPGCTINIPAGIQGARPVRLHVTAQRNNPDGSVHAAGRTVRADGTHGRQIGVTLHPVHAPRITVDNPHNDTATGITTAGRSYSVARTGSTVYVWGDSSEPKEIRCDSEQDAATKFGELSCQLAGQQP